MVITLENISEPNIIWSVGDSVTKSNVAMDPKKDIIKLLPIRAVDFFQFKVQQESLREKSIREVFVIDF